GLQLGHLALLIGTQRANPNGRDMLIRRLAFRAVCSGLSVNRRHGSPYWPGDDGRRYGRGRAALQPPAIATRIGAKMLTRHRNPACGAFARLLSMRLGVN